MNNKIIFLLKGSILRIIGIIFISFWLLSFTTQLNYLEPTYDFTFLSNQWLTMPDGVKLSVDYWLPKAHYANEKFPAVLEVLPYRKDDSFYKVDYPIEAYLARRGIVGVRVDMRGTGASEGITPDREYSKQELADISVIINQLASKPWSNGNIGMQGKSWGAFNALMIAMQRPSHLKGILIAHGSEDLYANDIHNIDGGLHLDIFTLEIDVDNLLPAYPNYEINEQYYKNRFDQTPWIFTYLKHQQDGPFWQQHSLQSNYASINIPVFAIASLLDGYRDFAVNMLDHVKSPMRVIMGPQNHAWPSGEPGPGYEWRQIATRFWQETLNGRDERIWREPKFTVFMRESVPASINIQKTPGSYWKENWPIDKTNVLRLFPQKDHSLNTQLTKKAQHALKYQPSVGKAVLNWWGETTPDMQIADKGTLVYDSSPLDHDLYVMGKPNVTLNVSANAPLADWIARLEDINPDGTVSFVTGGLINGAHRESRALPKSIERGKFFQLKFPMHFTTWKFAKGHKIRFVISNAQFPMIWPTPYKMTTILTVGDGTSELTLPIVEKSKEQRPILPNLESEELPHDAHDIKTISLTPFTMTHDSKGNTLASAKEIYHTAMHGNKYAFDYKVTYQVNDNDPADAAFIGEGIDTVYVGKSNRLIKAESTIHILSDKKYFHTTVIHKISENNKLLRIRVWKENIPRNFQ